MTKKIAFVYGAEVFERSILDVATRQSAAIGRCRQSLSLPLFHHFDYGVLKLGPLRAKESCCDELSPLFAPNCCSFSVNKGFDDRTSASVSSQNGTTRFMGEILSLSF